MTQNESPKLVLASSLFQSALAAHRSGRLQEAEQGYRQALANDERHADSFHMLAILQNQKGNLREAETLIRRALAIREDARTLVDLASILQIAGRIVEFESILRRALCVSPDFVPAQYNLAHLLQDTNRLKEAETAYFRLLEIKPDFALAYFNLGGLFRNAKRDREAELAYRHALTLKPDLTDAQNILNALIASQDGAKTIPISRSAIAAAILQSAQTLQQTGRLTEAEKACRQILVFDHGNALALNFLALILVERNATGEAETYFRCALKIRDDPAFHVNLGNLLWKTVRLQEAEASYRRALVLDSAFTSAHYNLGNLLHEAKRYPEAEAAYRNAIIANPNRVEAHNNLGLLFQETDRFQEAESEYQQAIDRAPQFVEALVNLGNLYLRTRQLQEAETYYRRALEINPNFAEANTNLGNALLSQGRYADAWPYHEWRNAPGLQSATVPLLFRQWRGEPLTGKSFTIWSEQGFGDIIQFARYAPMLKELGVVRLVFVCPSALKPSMETLEGVDEVVAEIGISTQTDFWSYSMSLAMHFGTTLDTIPAHLPYLHTSTEREQRWRTRIPATTGLKVGLAWKGNPNHKNDSNRSLPALSTLAQIWKVPGIVFISLQKGVGEEEVLQSLDVLPLVPLGSEIQDFGDTAAIIAQLDLVIGVDTAVAHLAGAMGKPCWILLPSLNTDWRWLEGRSDSPWYPKCARLFRQTKAGDWVDTVDELTTALQNFATGKSINSFGSSLPAPSSQVKNVSKTASFAVQLPDAPFATNAGNSTASFDSESVSELFRNALHLQQAGRHVEVEKICWQILAIDNSHADAYDLLGVSQFLQGRIYDAELFILRALALREEAGFLIHLGNILWKSARIAQAKEAYKRAIDKAPDHALAHYNLGNLFLETKSFPDAEAAYRTALSAKPDFAEAYLNLGLVLQECDRWSEAEILYRSALSFQCDLIEGYVNLGLTLQKNKQLEKAESSFRRALALNPDHPEANANLGRLLLALGRYAEAWPHHEYCFDPRIKNNIDTISNLPYKRWRGEDLTRKSLLIWPEHGFGDYIQLVRYTSVLKARGVARLTVACTPPLKRLFECLKGVDVVIADIATIAPHDYWTFPWNLPRHINTTLETIPATLPYLHASPGNLSKWKGRIPQTGRKVGLVWKDKFDGHRALPRLSVLAPLWKIPGITFISLQKGMGEDEALQAPSAQPIIPLGSEIVDFADTAAIVGQLDLVICIDSAIAHLASALGKPCWVLLPFFADCRWLLERSDSPWYPGVTRLFRNANPDDWTDTINQVALALENLVSIEV